ncbi:hypothetical protein BR93DRAFT_680459 [Coniochaeta sp. PMI_546]|nr:hypothetical protein BR93DRAFT_680459 [Coniochaeta sp. PMI_546]
MRHPCLELGTLGWSSGLCLTLGLSSVVRHVLLPLCLCFTAQSRKIHNRPGPCFSSSPIAFKLTLSYLDNNFVAGRGPVLIKATTTRA